MLAHDVGAAHDELSSLVDPDAEAAAPEQRRRLQERRFAALIDRLLAADGLQAARLRAAGVRRAGDVTLDEIAGLPMVHKQDLRDHGSNGFQAVGIREVACLHGSTGTEGKPVLVPYTASDVDVWARVMARALGGAGARQDSTIHNAYGYGMFTGGMGMHHGGMRLGATVLPAAGGLTERQVRLIASLRPDVLCCTPSYAVQLGEALAGHEAAADSLRLGVLGAEPWSERLRARIEGSLGIRTMDIYGLCEVIGPGVAGESPGSGGMLNIAEDHFYPEVLDADGTPLPDGVPGELVFSTLTKTGMPLLRYRSGDVAALAGPAPGAARTLRRMSKVLGRIDDLLTIGEVRVFPTDVEQALLAEARASPHYQLVEDRTREHARLHVAVEPADPQADTAHLDEAIAGMLRERLGLTCEVHVLPPGTLPRAETGKAQRLIRWTEGAPPLPGLG